MYFLFRSKNQSTDSKENSSTIKRDYRAVAKTDTGSVRSHNEDNLIFIRPFDENKRETYGCLAIVADGMGGHNSGEIASRIAVDTITENYFGAKQKGLEALQSAFEKANKQIFKKGRKEAAFNGMGTTCTAVVLLNEKIIIGHIGDSRAYQLNEGELIQLSKDDTYVQHLLDSGLISPEESKNHPKRNVVTKAMGTSSKLKAEFAEMEIPFGESDKLLLCSDGLYEYLSTEEIKSFLEKTEVHLSADRMIELAKLRGGHDNISVLIVEAFQDDGEMNCKLTQKI